MKLNRMSFFTLVFALIFTCLAINAQNSQQFKILNNYESIPFEDGKTVVAEVSFIGIEDDSDLRKVLKYYQVNINTGDLFGGSKVSKAVRAIRESLAFEGYDKAEILALGEQLPNNQMKLIFSVNRGEKAEVLEILFEGNNNISSEELVANVKQCFGNIWMRFVKRNYDYFTQKCSRELMQSKGYLKSEIKNILYQPDGNKNTILIEVKEGIRFLIGEINIQGLTVFSKEKFLEMLGQKTGDIANGKILREFLYDKLSDSYKNIGYLNYDAELDPEFINPENERQDGLLKLKIIIDEGRQFKLLKAKIVGVSQTESEKIRKMLPIKDGEIYNPSKVKKWADEINKMNKFGFFDFEKDVELPIYEDSNYVYLIAKINPK